jgi:hypothetical protein
MKQKLNKLDEIEIGFVDQPWTDEERKAFSTFLKTRRLKTSQPKNKSTSPNTVFTHFRAS